MAVQIRKTTFDEFFDNRDALIYKYQKGDISKKEFIEEHYYFITRLNLKPFQKIDSFEKGIYNYQYYNAVAKYNTLRIRDKKLIEKHPDIVREIENKIKVNYSKKDESVIRLLRFLDYENIEAYYVKSKSDYLDNKLIEIVLLDYDNVILHTINRGIVEELKREGVFDDVRKRSKIDNYVNKKY
ncbi:DUF6648 family protein [Clostridium aminobutyricum]|uniref:Uncharacterized protein n=1 Tax=Clostridium aminobutyricum TaxID=33953 RepID=A0A939D7A2_CLOAM|nr:DUF6648 family protein [Clostridium aminobutyricum]MBN7772385.1 hypothetical protein [Clostridium aminobutyricum]